MSIIQFRVHLSEQQVVDAPIDAEKPVYLVVSALTHHHQLPTVVGGYGLFAGAERRPLSREVTLSHTPYASGGELYLAPVHATWWTPIPAPTEAAAVASRLTTRSFSAYLQLPITPKTAGLVAAGVVTIAMLGLLIWPQSIAEQASGGSDLAILAPSVAVVAPTATLLPATPTLDPATEARSNYQDGMTAYAAENWPIAAEHFHRVYAYDASYSDVRNVLAATLYNWGVTSRDGRDLAAAQAHFQSALEVDSDHSLAQSELERATLFLKAQAAAQSGDLQGAIDGYHELIALNSGDYAGATAQIYELLIRQASAVAGLGGEDNLRKAYGMYGEAAGLEVADRSGAEQAMRELEAMLPTPTPRPTAVPKKLRFVAANYDDNPQCISVRINGIVPSGWTFAVDGIRGISGVFDGGGNARACGLAPGQEVTITVFDGNGRLVAGGGGIPSKGSAIMVANWK